MNAIETIDRAFGWSSGTIEQKPASNWNAELKKDPTLVESVKTYIKTSNITGEKLDIFYWWMGVTLNLIPSDLRKKTT